MLVILSSNAQNLLIQPQKIIIDSIHNRYIVSNFGGGGDLVAIDNFGNQSYFVENAGMIDALTIVDDTIYGTAWGGKIKGYSLETGLPIMDLDLSGEGVYLLTGLVTDNSGNIFATERIGDRIFKINPYTREYWVFAEGNGIIKPNGLLYEPEFNRILVCLDKPNPPILGINLSDSTVYIIANTTLAGSDGIAKDLENNYYITGYELPGIYKFDPDFSGEPELFYEDDEIIYPTFNLQHNSLLITLYSQNNWAEIFLTPSSIIANESRESFEFLNCYPNPFTNHVNIQFEMKIPGNTKLEIYDQNGKLIETIINEKKPAGIHTVRWDEVNYSGKNITNGICFFKLSINDKIMIQKAVRFKR